MPKLPCLSGKIIIKKLGKYGYVVARQKGSHVRLRHNNSTLKPITIPLHKVIKPGLLHQILKDADLTIEEFLDL
jgi:predicted RNA binding protein YcfA (HicA-like mRNA interferase family)